MLDRVVVQDGRPRTITFVNDADGLVVARREADQDGDHGDPAEIRYRFAGREMGYVGNNDTTDKSYTETVAMRTRAYGTTWYGSGAFRSGQLSGVATGEFADGFDAITSFSQGSQGGGYTVRGGDTLAGIAGQQWGDASLWYKLAQANGLAGDAVLQAGQQLIVPHGVMRSSHNAATFKAYDPAEALGDVNPAAPAPRTAPKNNKCGGFGAVLLAAVAIAVSVLSYGALTGPTTGLLGTIGVGAVSGAAGSIACLGVGLATGLQNKFSWNGVGSSALGGPIQHPQKDPQSVALLPNTTGSTRKGCPR